MTTRKKTGPGKRTGAAGMLPSVLDVPIAAVLAAGVERRRPPEGASAKELRYYRGMLSCFQTLAAFWADRRIGEVNEATCLDYFVFRRLQGIRLGPRAAGTRDRLANADAEKRTVGMNTMVSEIEVLKTETNAYARAHQLTGKIEAKVRRERAETAPMVGGTDVARILWACLGYRWEVGTRRLVPLASPGDRRTIRRHRKPLARLIRIIHRSGTEVACATRLRWGPGGPGESYLDVDGGQIHRLGPDAAAGKAAGMPSYLPVQLIATLARWEAADLAAGRENVIYGDLFGGEQPSLTRSFRSACRDAGLGDDVTLGSLRQATAKRIVRRGVPTPSGAAFVGMDVEFFERAYSSERPDYQSEELLALHRPSPTVISIRRGSGTADWQVGPER